MAERDRFGAGGTRCRPSTVLCTVLVGSTHDSIALAPGGRESPGTGLRSTRDRTLLAHVVEGVPVTDDGLDAWHDRLAAANVRLLPGTGTRAGRVPGRVAYGPRSTSLSGRRSSRYTGSDD